MKIYYVESLRYAVKVGEVVSFKLKSAFSL